MHEYLERVWHDIGSLGSAAAFGILLFFLFFYDVTLFFRFFTGGMLLFGATSLIRIAYFKERPLAKPYSSRIGKIDAASFPSTHAARGSLVLTLLWPGLSSQLRIPLAILALLICTSRIARRRHDSIDVIAGLILGIIVGWAILQF